MSNTEKKYTEQDLQAVRADTARKIQSVALEPILLLCDILKEHYTKRDDSKADWESEYPYIMRTMALGAYMQTLLICANKGEHVHELPIYFLEDAINHWRKGV